MGKYQIKFSKTASKSYQKIPLSYKQIVNNNLLKLQNGDNTDIKAIKGEENCYRLRIGKYRILFTIIDDLVIVSDIGTRGDI